jgi:hypothetical protein
VRRNGYEDAFFSVTMNTPVTTLVAVMRPRR